MFLELEKRIVNNQYTNLNDDTKIWSFGKIDDKTTQIIMSSFYKNLKMVMVLNNAN